MGKIDGEGYTRHKQSMLCEYFVEVDQRKRDDAQNNSKTTTTGQNDAVWQKRKGNGENQENEWAPKEPNHYQKADRNLL